MEHSQQVVSAQDIQEMARQTIDVLRQEHTCNSPVDKQGRGWSASLHHFLEALYRIDTPRLTEDEFASLSRDLTEVLDRLEDYLTKYTKVGTAERQLMVDAISDIRAARHWILQGHSPDPKSRPSVGELQRLTHERAVEAWKQITS